MTNPPSGRPTDPARPIVVQTNSETVVRKPVPVLVEDNSGKTAWIAGLSVLATRAANDPQADSSKRSMRPGETSASPGWQEAEAFFTTSWASLSFRRPRLPSRAACLHRQTLQSWHSLIRDAGDVAAVAKTRPTSGRS